MKRDVVLLSHYDLDGAGCSVLSDHIWNVVDRKHQGYGKIRASLGYLIGQYYKKIDTIVIADLKIEEEDLLLAMFAFPNVIYYDHHESSEEFSKYADNPYHPAEGSFEFHFDLEFSSTALMWMDGARNKGAQRTSWLDAFMNAVNTYDMWKTENKRWEQSVMMNDLFWNLHMDDFRARFKDGLKGFTDAELQWHEGLKQQRQNVIENATVEEMESGSKVVVISESKAINFVTSYMDGDVFYIISPDFSKHNVSVRIKDSDPSFNVNNGIKDLPTRHPNLVQSAGGHASAGGITFAEDLSLNEIVDLLYEEDEAIRSAA